MILQHYRAMRRLHTHGWLARHFPRSIAALMKAHPELFITTETPRH